MPTPMKFDDAVRLCGVPKNVGSPVTIQDMLYNRFGIIQGARSGSFADREKAYLTKEGSSAGGRADMWSQHLGDVRPFTDGVKVAMNLPAIVAQDYVQVRPSVNSWVVVQASAFKA